MLWLAVISIVLAGLTGFFIVMEINWSIHNFLDLANRKGIKRILCVPMMPLCFMPVILDVLITIGIAKLIGTSGMIGMFMSAVVCSFVAGYLFYKRRKMGWRYM